jgi:methylated-DNA-[protein]-cysteine S-methyltransferase
MTYAPDHALIATPIGMIRLVADGDALTHTAIEPDNSDPERPGSTPVLREAEAQILAYFTGSLRDFDLPLTPAASPRGEELRAGIAGIGFGDMLSYGALARMLDSGPRAVGQACARNPFPIIIPCHRVLASGDKLGAYSGGRGPTTKLWLLDHESRHSGKVLPWPA